MATAKQETKLELTKEQDEFSIEYLKAALVAGTITEEQEERLGNLLITSSADKKKKFIDDKMNKIKAYILEQGLTVEAVYNALKPPAKLIFSWTDSKGVNHQRFEGAIGKAPVWVNDLKNTLTKDEALKLVVDNAQKGKDFVEALYKVKN